MAVQREPGVETVIAAQSGDHRALDELVACYLPLVYNVVGHALRGHADTDDVVQDTMLRAVNGLGGLRDPASFRSWLVVIAMNQVRERHRARLRTPAADDVLEDIADPGADFVDLTIVRLQLSGQRREVVAATRWLSEEDRELLSLWWLEAAGRLTRVEVSTALGLTPQHTAVRVQRMKAQLDAARVVVRALRQNPICPDLADLVSDWDGEPSALWRKRIARHSRECPRCVRFSDNLASVEGLLAKLPLVPLPAALAFDPSQFAAHLAVHKAAATTAVKPAGAGKLALLWQSAVAKPIAAAAAAAVVITAVVVAQPSPEPQASVAVTSEARPTGTPSSTPLPSPPLPPSTQAPVVPPGPPPVVPVAKSAKKGVSTWHFDGVTEALGDVRAGWYYTWAADSGQITAPAGVEFVPMIWGADSADQATLDKARGQGKALLGFNEPDFADQANMTVEQALGLWPRLESTGLRLGSPGVAFGGDQAGGWLDRFMTGAAARGLRVDFIALHWYGSDFGPAAVGHLGNYLEAVHARYGKPVWLTEYSLIDFSSGSARYPSPGQQAAFARDSSAMMEQLSYVERYAWFALPADKPGTGLYTDGKTPTAAGAAYREAG